MCQSDFFWPISSGTAGPNLPTFFCWVRLGQAKEIRIQHPICKREKLILVIQNWNFIPPCFDKPKLVIWFKFIATQCFVCSIKSKRKLQVSGGLASMSQFLLRSKFCIAGTNFYCFIIIHIMHQNA